MTEAVTAEILLIHASGPVQVAAALPIYAQLRVMDSGITTTSNIDYTYTLAAEDQDTGVARVNSMGVITGLKIGMARIIVGLASDTEYKATPVTFVVTVGDGHTVTPDTQDCPAHSQAKSQAAAVKAVLDDLMPAIQDGDIPDKVKNNLFGFDHQYFQDNDNQTGRRTIFQIRESNDIYQASCTATSHLTLKAVKELILGDDLEFSCTRGNTFSVNLNLNDKSDKAASEQNIEGSGVTNTSVSGITSTLNIDSRCIATEDHYSYDGMPDMGYNSIHLPIIKKIELDYGNIISTRRDRSIKLEFINPNSSYDRYGRNKLSPKYCSYANFSLASEQRLRKPTITITPSEKNLGWLADYFYGTTENGENIPGLMEQYSNIDLPVEFLNDDILNDGRANVLQFLKTKGQLRYEYMEGPSKKVEDVYALHNVYKCKDFRQRITLAPLNTEAFFCMNISNQYVSAVGSNLRFSGMDMDSTFSVVKTGISCTVFDRKSRCGNTLKESAGVDMENSMALLAHTVMKLQATVQEQKNTISEIKKNVVTLEANEYVLKNEACNLTRSNIGISMGWAGISLKETVMFM